MTGDRALETGVGASDAPRSLYDPPRTAAAANLLTREEAEALLKAHGNSARRAIDSLG